MQENKATVLSRLRRLLRRKSLLMTKDQVQGGRQVRDIAEEVETNAVLNSYNEGDGVQRTG